MKFLEDLEWERARKAFSLPFVFGSEYKVNWRWKPFRSLDCWWYHSEFRRSLAESMWVEVSSVEPRRFRIIKRLRLLKKNSRIGFVFLDKQLREAKLLISDMDHVAETRAVSDMAFKLEHVSCQSQMDFSGSKRSKPKKGNFVS
jgi:hypothetical protein